MNFHALDANNQAQNVRKESRILELVSWSLAGEVGVGVMMETEACPHGFLLPLLWVAPHFAMAVTTAITGNRSAMGAVRRWHGHFGK